MRIIRRVAAAGLATAAALAASALTAPTALADGLNGSYYAFSADPDNLAGAQAMIAAASSPTATFTATSICYPNCTGGEYGDGGDLSGFLGSGATGLSSDVTGLADHAIVLNGFFNNTGSAGTFTFNLGSDDGSALYINGVEVIDNDGDHGERVMSGSATLQAGLNSIRVVQFEDQENTALSLTDANGNAIGGAELVSSAPTSPVSAAPEPAAWALMLGGVGMLGGMLRVMQARRREDEVKSVATA